MDANNVSNNPSSNFATLKLPSNPNTGLKNNRRSLRSAASMPPQSSDQFKSTLKGLLTSPQDLNAGNKMVNFAIKERDSQGFSDMV